MLNSTKEAIRQSAHGLLKAIEDPEAAHKEFLTKVETRFTTTPEGLSHDDYLAAANSIWDEVKLQRSAKAGQPQQSEGKSANQ